MKAETAKLLREPFPAEVVGKLPRVWCKACRDGKGRACQEHTKRRCRDCQNNITDAHLHLDYVGHAETTDRFLAADPEWTWEPLALDANGLPAFDRFGGLWIRLTIAGVTRLGYGAATEGKTGPDAVKEVIGDALRNAGMRFGVALDLWGAKFKDSTEEHDEPEVAPLPTPDQVALFAALTKAIDEALSADDIATVGQRVKAGTSAGKLTSSQYTALSRRAGAKVAALPAGEPAQGELVAVAQRGVHRDPN